MITLKTLHLATEQEVYNQVKTHLLTQKCKSGDASKCLYRGPNNTKCAAGILIADDEYTIEMESCGGWGSVIRHNLAPDTHSKLISDLQKIHDSIVSPATWEERLYDLALRYNLVP